MRNDIRSFPQHSMETCGISCMLMVLDLHQKIDYPSVKLENKYYKDFRSRAFCGTTGAAITDCLSSKGLTVRLYHSSQDILENRDGYYPQAMHRRMLAEYKNTLWDCAPRSEVYAGCTITTDALKELLDDGNTLFLHTLVPGDSLLTQLRFSSKLIRYHCPEESSPQELYADELEEVLTAQEASALERQVVFPGHLNISVILRGTAAELLKLLRAEKITHWILAYGYENDTFLLCDPMADKVKFTMTARELEGFLDTPLGRTCIAVSE